MSPTGPGCFFSYITGASSLRGEGRGGGKLHLPLPFRGGIVTPLDENRMFLGDVGTTQRTCAEALRTLRARSHVHTRKRHLPEQSKETKRNDKVVNVENNRVIIYSKEKLDQLKTMLQFLY